MAVEVNYSGIFKDVFEGFINYRRSLGYKYSAHSQKMLLRLIKHLEKYHCNGIVYTEAVVKDFIKQFQNKSAGTIRKNECLVRQFGLYLRNCGYKEIYILPKCSIFRAASDFVPYIFTHEEISRIFDATNRIPIKKHGIIDRLFYQTIFRMLYATGMRVGEAVSLTIENVDLGNDVITVLNGKDRVSRLIPFHPSLHYWLEKYNEMRRKSSDYYFFQSDRGGHRKAQAVLAVFQNSVLPLAGINPNRGSCMIRVHDVRHTFACHALDKMIKDGRDPFCALPYLSAYMGHKDIKSTELYLRLTDERFNEIIDAGSYIYEGIGDADD